LIDKVGYLVEDVAMRSGQPGRVTIRPSTNDPWGELSRLDFDEHCRSAVDRVTAR
jgi:hypothetical protein